MIKSGHARFFLRLVNRISPITYNLFDSALAYCPPDECIRVAPTHIVLRLHNSGVVLPDCALDRLFERFFSLSLPDGSGYGSRLGLNFICEIVFLYHGMVELFNHDNDVAARLIFANNEMADR